MNSKPRISNRLVAALAKGWRNVEVDAIDGNRMHANATVKSLWLAGYKIVRRPKPKRFIRKRK